MRYRCPKKTPSASLSRGLIFRARLWAKVGDGMRGYLHQLEPDIRHAVLGNAGTIISFRVGAEDAPYLEQEFQQRFDRTDVTQLGNYQVYLKLMIDGVPSKPFSAITLPAKP